MPAANSLTSKPVTVTAEELDSAHDVLTRLITLTRGTELDWYVLMAARSLVGRSAHIAKYGSVPA